MSLKGANHEGRYCFTAFCHRHINCSRGTNHITVDHIFIEIVSFIRDNFNSNARIKGPNWQQACRWL